MEKQVRELLHDLAAEVPHHGSVPSDLPARARRQIALRVVASALVVALVAFGVVSLRSAIRSSPKPAQPSPNSLFDDVHGWITCGSKDGVVAVNPDPAEGEPSSITLSHLRALHGVDWSSDGSKLLITREHGFSILNADGSTTWVRVGGTPYSGSLTPDGTQIVYANASDLNLYEVAVDGGEPQSIAIGSAEGTGYLAPMLSPDGTLLAYLRLAHHRSRGVWAIGIDGRGDRPVAIDDRLRADITGMSWSQDGTRLAIGAYTRQHFRKIYIAGLDGSRPTLVARHAQGPIWSPDGLHIAFSSVQHGLSSMSPDGSDVQLLGPASLTWGCVSLAWNPVR